MKDQHTYRSRPYPQRLPPVLDQPTQSVPQPSVVFEERSGAWAVLLGRECLASGFPTLSAAWDYIDRREVSLRYTHRTVVHNGDYTLKRE
jgi:hypothetical protein